MVADSRITYESGAKEWHLDIAARYSNSFGPLDIGFSAFDGTAREPVLRAGLDSSGAPALFQHYGQIRQFGLDAQLTLDSLLLKLETIYRQGARNGVRSAADPSFSGRREDYAAFVGGGEYAFHGVLNTEADLTLFAEWLHDGRRHRATNQYQNDLFLAARIAFNDADSAELLVSTLLDMDHATRTPGLEFKRSLTDSVSLKAEAVILLAVDKADLAVRPIRRDSFFAVNLTYSF